jgi:hypothetical protein
MRGVLRWSLAHRLLNLALVGSAFGCLRKTPLQSSYAFTDFARKPLMPQRNPAAACAAVQPVTALGVASGLQL